MEASSLKQRDMVNSPSHLSCSSHPSNLLSRIHRCHSSTVSRRVVFLPIPDRSNIWEAFDHLLRRLLAFSHNFKILRSLSRLALSTLSYHQPYSLRIRGLTALALDLALASLRLPCPQCPHSLSLLHSYLKRLDLHLLLDSAPNQLLSSRHSQQEGRQISRKQVSNLALPSFSHSNMHSASKPFRLLSE